MLGRKQSATHEDFVAALASIATTVPRPVYDRLVDETADKVRKAVAGKRAAYAWSGGKDSLALQAVMQRAGVTECVFGMTDHLEYPAFLRWVTDNMPPGLTVIKNKWDLRWLACHQDMLFPRNAAIAGKWFKGIQHAAQDQYFKRRGLDVLILGRRKADGNYVGGPSFTYRSRGIVRYSPLADWTHEHVLASLFYEGWAANLPPFYSWPRGFRCGTHAWPARQWCPTIQDGWAEVYSIDASIVVDAARLIPTAAKFLSSIGAAP